MIIKKKPKKPQRGYRTESISLGYNDRTIDYLVKMCNEKDIDLTKATIRSSYLSVRQPESELSYKNKLGKWQNKIDAYNKWYEDNKEEIEAELAKQARIEEEKRQKEIASLKKKLAKLEKESANV